MGYEYFYQGASSSLEPTYGNIFTGYRVPAGELGATTSVQTANQIREVTNLLNQGIKNVEVSVLQPETFEMIPTQHLKEIGRLGKLTGSEASLHAPIIDPSGFKQQGWDETDRVEAEQQLKRIVERAHELDSKGNIPVTIHASAVPGTEQVEIKDKDGKIIEVPQRMIAVNQESGEFIPLTREERFYPGSLKEVEGKWKGKFYEAKEELVVANRSYWDSKLSQLIFYKERGDELIKNNEPLVEEIYPKIASGEINPNNLPPTIKSALNALTNSKLYLDNTYQTANSLFNQAYKFSNEEGKTELVKASNEFKENLKVYQSTGGNPKFLSDALQGLLNKMYYITAEDEKLTPQIYKPMEEFTKDKASQTLANVALSSYKKFGDNSPIISIENPPYGTALARAQDLKDLVQATREKFVEQAKKQGLSGSEAQAAAEKLIGVTWDTSHIAMMRKSGFGNNKLVEEAEKIAPFVKHVHYNDNLGSTHTDLPPGLGSVPMKEIMEKLEKAGFHGKKVFEGGNFFQHFQTSPHPYVLEGSGSPMFNTGGPYWNQTLPTYGNYFAFPSSYLPEQHFSLYGGGFSNLPAELGGQIPGKGSRVSGAPMD